MSIQLFGKLFGKYILIHNQNAKIPPKDQNTLIEQSTYYIQSINRI